MIHELLIKFNLALPVTSLENINLLLFKPWKRTTRINALNLAPDKGEWPASRNAYINFITINIIINVIITIIQSKKNPSGLRI
jgi:hypothetical protein